MIDLESYFVRHILTTDLTCEVIAFHDLLPERTRHELSLTPYMILAKCCLIANLFKLIVPLIQPVEIVRALFYYVVYGICIFLIVFLLIPCLLADTAENVCMRM